MLLLSVSSLALGAKVLTLNTPKLSQVSDRVWTKNAPQLAGMITNFIASDDSIAGSCLYSNSFVPMGYQTHLSMMDVNNELITLVVEKLPFLQGAIGVGSGNIIIYRGAYTYPVPVDRIVAYTDRPNIGSTVNNYRLCTFEHSNFGQYGKTDISIGELVIDWYTANGDEPLGTPLGSYKLAEMFGNSPFELRMEHVGDAIFVDSLGKYSFDVSGYNRLYDLDQTDRSQGGLEF